jgi:hypothetical protein
MRDISPLRRRSFFLSVTFPGHGGFKSRRSFAGVFIVRSIRQQRIDSGLRIRQICRFDVGRYFMLTLLFSCDVNSHGAVF